MVVHKEVIVTATSSESWEDAALRAVERTDRTVENLQWAVVEDLSIDIDEPAASAFKSKVKVGFEVED